MNSRFTLPIFSLLILLSCGHTKPESTSLEIMAPVDEVLDTIKKDSVIGNTIKDRFTPPNGYERVQSNDAYKNYLRTLPLKPSGSSVLYYNGQQKDNYDVYAAVVDLPIGKKDLHQCADAVMRLRAEHLWKTKQYKKIHFKYTNGFNVPYSKWRLGYRVKVKGNKCTWVKTADTSDSYTTYWKYMEAIFNYAGTMSLSKELKKVDRDSMQIGDVFIQGGFPGHAIVVVDMAVNTETKKKVFMLAQSYMPAQELQVLMNPNDSNNGTWYDLNFGDTLDTPEWSFTKENLKRFEE